MHATSDKVNFLQICMMLGLMNGLANHVIINPMLLDASGRDAWLTVIVAGALFLAWLPPLLWLMRRSGQQRWRPWLSRQTSPFVSWLLVAPLCAELYLVGGMTVVHTATWNITNYLPYSP